VNVLALTVMLLVGADPWSFDDERVRVEGKGQTKDSLSTAALSRLGLKLEGVVVLKASAHANTVGGVTLHLEDPSDAKASCDLYAKVDGETLRFSDSRCSFLAFSGNLRTTATCRKISGQLRRGENGLELEATSPDCTAQPLGVPLSLSGTLVPAKKR
jgi:hypothetical protein